MRLVEGPQHGSDMIRAWHEFNRFNPGVPSARDLGLDLKRSGGPSLMVSDDHLGLVWVRDGDSDTNWRRRLRCSRCALRAENDVAPIAMPGQTGIMALGTLPRHGYPRYRHERFWHNSPITGQNWGGTQVPGAPPAPVPSLRTRVPNEGDPGSDNRARVASSMS